MSTVIDLRSDTFTVPTEAMRLAMYRAEVGDDMVGEDPTVRELEEMAAQKVGKEAAMLTISGTMGNLVALLTHCSRGEAAVVGDQSHILHLEAGGGAALGGLIYRTVHTDWQGMPDLGELADVIKPASFWFPRTGVVCLENTCSRRGGTVLPSEKLRQVRSLVNSRSVPVHLDGSRVFNAAVALGIDARELTREADTVMFCLSKGLSAPLGSILAGPSDFIDRARYNRRLVGGNMRQAGVVAACGIVALNEMVDRLAEDHENARILAESIHNIPGIAVDLNKVQSNMVYFEITTPGIGQDEVQAALAENGLKMYDYLEFGLRMVTYRGITREDVARAAKIIRKVMGQLQAGRRLESTVQ